MLSSLEKKIITLCAEKYKVRAVLLFGSNLEKNIRARDIDLGVDGIHSSVFFRFYGDLMKSLSRPVDVVYLTGRRDYLADQIRKKGRLIYGKKSSRT